MIATLSHVCSKDGDLLIDGWQLLYPHSGGLKE